MAANWTSLRGFFAVTNDLISCVVSATGGIGAAGVADEGAAGGALTVREGR